MPVSEKGAVRLLDAVTALSAISHCIGGETLETYRARAMLRDAVERRLQIFGEALTIFRRLDPETAALIEDLPRAIQLRRSLAHDDGAVDDEIIWDVATVHYPGIHDVITRLLASEHDRRGGAENGKPAYADPDA